MSGLAKKEPWSAMVFLMESPPATGVTAVQWPPRVAEVLQMPRPVPLMDPWSTLTATNKRRDVRPSLGNERYALLPYDNRL